MASDGILALARQFRWQEKSAEMALCVCPPPRKSSHVLLASVLESNNT